MFDKWIRTARKPIGGGLAVKTLDCRDVERKIIDALEGRMEGITEVIYGNYCYLKGYRAAYNNNGYEFFAPDESNAVNLEDWKYVGLEKWNNTLFVHVTDMKEEF